MTSVRTRFPLLLVAGVMLVQAAWILAMPPFRGIDEFDHVYRAASVAEGQWRPTVPAPDGRGLEVTIPGSIIDAASAQCSALPYTGTDNCTPIESFSDGRASVATAAGSYNPVYYAVLAPAALALDGAGVVYGMRAITALLLLVGVGLSALCLVRAGGRTWTRLGLVVSMTPVFLYTTVLPAPNGLEMVAGLGLWSALLALYQAPPDRRAGWVLGFATASAGALAMTRMLGPMWLALIVLTFVALFGWSRTVAVVRARPRAWGAATIAVLLCGAFNAWWTVSAGMLGTSPDVEPGSPGSFEWGSKPVLWVLQTIAAFPTRTESASPVVYGICLLVFVALVAAGLGAARSRGRAVLIAMALVVALLPLALTSLTAANHGVIWQGRYGLAYAVGLPLVAGTLLDRRWSPRWAGGPALIGVALLGVAHAWSIVGVRLLEGRNPVSAGDPAWLMPSPVVLVVVVGLGFLIIGYGVGGASHTTRSTEQERDGTDGPSDSGDGRLREGAAGSPQRGAVEPRGADASA